MAGCPARVSRVARSSGSRSSHSARRAVHGQHRRGLGQAVDLHELPAELGLDAGHGLGGRRGAGHDDPHLVAAGDLALPGLRRLEHRRDDGRSRAHDRDAVLLDAAQDLGAVDLADHDLLDAEAGHREGHPPAVGVEHRQRVQVDVAVGHAGVQREGHRVGPDVAVGDLDALGACGGAGGVVDRRGGVLLVLPGLGFLALEVHVLVVADEELVLALDVLHRLLELGVDVEDAGAGVLDDVLHLVGREPEVDRHQHPSVAGDAEERGVEAGAVVREIGDPLAEPDAELVELRRLGPRELAHPRVGQVAERLRGLVGLVDDADAIGVHGQGAVEKVGGRERHDHGVTPLTVGSAHPSHAYGESGGR